MRITKQSIMMLAASWVCLYPLGAAAQTSILTPPPRPLDASRSWNDLQGVPTATSRLGQARAARPAPPAANAPRAAAGGARQQARLTGHFDSAIKLGGSPQRAPQAAQKLQRAQATPLTELSTSESSRRVSAPKTGARAGSSVPVPVPVPGRAVPDSPTVPYSATLPADRQPLPTPPPRSETGAGDAANVPEPIAADGAASIPGAIEPTGQRRPSWTLVPGEVDQDQVPEQVAEQNTITAEVQGGEVGADAAPGGWEPGAAPSVDFPAPVVQGDVGTVPSAPEFEIHSDAAVAAESESAAEDGIEQELLSEQSPVLEVRTFGPRTVVVGRAAEYHVMVHNASDAEAGNVELRVTVPSWAEIQNTDGAAGSAVVEPDGQGNSLVRWSIRQLAGMSQERLTLQIVPRTSRPFDLGVTWSFTPASSLARIQVQEPKLEMSIVGPADVLYGETKVYTLLISNPGTGPTGDVALTLMPLEPGEQSPGQRNLGPLKAGERKSIDLELTARQAGRLQVRATVETEGGLRAEGVQEVLVRRGRLNVEVEGPARKFAGSEATYLIRVANDGDAVASDVTAVVTLPAGVQFVSATEGGQFRSEQRQVTWPIGALRSGAVRELQLSCRVTASGENRFDVRTVASGDLNHLASVTTDVEALADLKLTVNDPQGAVPVGTNTDYEIHVVNRGTKAAENVTVVGYFSEGIEPVAISGWRGAIGEGQVVLEQIPRVAPGQEMVFRVTAVASKVGNHVFRAELECPAPETRLAQEEWTRFYDNDGSVETAQRDSSATREEPNPRRDGDRGGMELRR